MGELWTRDLRKDAAAKLKSPVLLITAAPQENLGVTAEEWKKRYEAQVKGVKGAKVVFAKKAKHFIMYDEPKWLNEQIAGFLDKNK
jgi:pimeloyl-ACP methyl ester carboxylesterase